MYTKPALPAAIIGTIATVGWVLQGLGNAYYYREVRSSVRFTRFWLTSWLQIWLHHKSAGHSMEKVRRRFAFSYVLSSHLDRVLSGKDRVGNARCKGILHARMSCGVYLDFLFLRLQPCLRFRCYVFGPNDYVHFCGPNTSTGGNPESIILTRSDLKTPYYNKLFHVLGTLVGTCMACAQRLWPVGV